MPASKKLVHLIFLPLASLPPLPPILPLKNFKAMKSLSLNMLSFLTAMLFFLSACNDSSENKTDPATGSDSADKNMNTTTTDNTTTTTNTIITTPQDMVIIRHKVKDFDAWKLAYEAHDSARLANGLHNYVIGRGLTDPNMVLVALKADDMAKAKTFAMNADLKKVMEKAGLTGAPIIKFVTNTFQDTAILSSTLRSMTSVKVKDWANWEKNFKDGEQERIDNGILTRVYGHDAGDDKQIRLVTAVMDTAKAFAYYKSDALKKRREAGGVISEPERFLFNVVKRY
jgi:hypothetical protein